MEGWFKNDRAGRQALLYDSTIMIISVLFFVWFRMSRSQLGEATKQTTTGKRSSSSINQSRSSLANYLPLLPYWLTDWLTETQTNTYMYCCWIWRASEWVSDLLWSIRFLQHSKPSSMKKPQVMPNPSRWFNPIQATHTSALVLPVMTTFDEDFRPPLLQIRKGLEKRPDFFPHRH